MGEVENLASLSGVLRSHNQTAAQAACAAANHEVRVTRERRSQLLRSPSAVRFHCVTFSAIIRVDFIAAWLSWA
jgi:hypothetical protein